MNLKKKNTDIYLYPLIFFSNLDEAMCYEWIEKLKIIKKWLGQESIIYLCIDKRRLTEKKLLELEMIYKRYDFENIEQLKIFFNKKNRYHFYLCDWFWENNNLIINKNHTLSDNFNLNKNNIIYTMGNKLNGGYHYDIFYIDKNIYKNYYGVFEPYHIECLIQLIPYYCIVRNLVYASKKDENVFFKKLEKISYIKDFVGLRWKLYIFFDKEKMSNDDYSECENLCKQYHGKIEKIVFNQN